jgi:hypothetical protein
MPLFFYLPLIVLGGMLDLYAKPKDGTERGNCRRTD